MAHVTLNEICCEMKALGFEYGSFVNPRYTTFEFIPQIQELTSIKPMGKVLWFSRITETDSRELTLGWKEWIEMEDFELEEYGRRGLLFVKVDSKLITSESHPSLGKEGKWRHEGKWMPEIKWQEIASEFAGISVCPSKPTRDNLFSSWDVDTIAIWDPCCIVEARAFNNTGAKWTYTTCRPV